MSHTNLQHRRTHNLLLISRLLNQRDAATPFTLVLDSLEQTGGPVVREYVRRANLAKTHVIFLGFETVRAPAGVDSFIRCYDKTPVQIQQAVDAVISSSTQKRQPRYTGHHLLIIDTLHPLATQSQRQQNSNPQFNLTHFLSSLIAPQPSQTTSLVAIYHTDIPLSRPTPTSTHSYHPTPLSLLTYLATTIITTHCLATLLSAKAAQERSLAAPTYGLDESKEGVIIGLKPGRYTRQLPPEQRGVVLELEHRRKSGRGVREWYFLPSSPMTLSANSQAQRMGVAGFKENVSLLDDHPLFRVKRADGEELNAAGEALAGLTFELGLTERQRAEREGVVLPYFDAQRDDGGFGPGEGGRILYDLGVEDDFDEEEDEI